MCHNSRNQQFKVYSLFMKSAENGGMRLKDRTGRRGLDMQRAETIALEALAFLAGDAARLTRFMEVSGIAPVQLAGIGDDRALQRGVLEHVLSDESALMVFCADSGHSHEEVTAAHGLIAGSHGREWND